MTTNKENGGDLEPLKLDFSSSSQAMIVAFGSLRLEKEIPPFEWTGILEDLPAKKIYVRDLEQLWYMKGLPGVSDSPEGVSEHLRQLINTQESKKTVTIGGSMGGYGALLFGHLLKADKVHAFSGQTYLPTRRGLNLARAVYRRRWRMLWKQRELLLNREINRLYFDLEPLLKGDSGRTTYHLYYSSKVASDLSHAQHVGDLPDVKLHEYSDIGHHVAIALRDSGELKQILLRSIEIEPQASKEADR